ncbi:midnolin-like [Notolabrus celidotus]|uniref:midnolin-like n=1 Tax=Notolabrus celidotus TaxID=1203425 RepID=UPI001490055C|nr:midnolin-like [Notolabrus celidotus]
MEQEQEQQQRGLSSFTPGRSACCGYGASTGPLDMRLSITSTTGSPVELTVPRGETVEGLRTHISHKLRMQTDRIVLLHKDRQLTAGRLLDLGVTDGSKLTLVPVVEAGLVCSTARAERSIMDVLESLTEVQIRDFLSGRSPLTLNLGIGAHVMYVQLQLSAQNVADLQQQHQHHQDLGTRSSKGLQTGLPTTAGMSPPGPPQALASANTATSTTPPISKSSTQTQNSSVPTSMTQLNTQRTRTSSNSTAPNSHSSSPAPVNGHHHSSSHQSCPPNTPCTPSLVLSTPCLPLGYPNPKSPLQAATPVCSPAPSGSNPGPPSPATATTLNECNIQASSPAERCKQPGAVIESFVSHSPGVFSGTFSGTLAPCSQSSITHPRGGIGIILQILNDLLRAAFHHQGASPAVSHSAASNPPVSPLLSAEEQNKAKSKAVETQSTEHLSKTPDEERPLLHTPTQENQALHCKLERLQFLMQQRRTRRKSHLSQTSHPYQHRHHHP